MKTKKKRLAKNSRFRPGATGECEAQLWTFVVEKGARLLMPLPMTSNQTVGVPGEVVVREEHFMQGVM